VNSLNINIHKHVIAVFSQKAAGDKMKRCLMLCRNPLAEFRKKRLQFANEYSGGFLLLQCLKEARPELHWCNAVMHTSN